VVRIDGDRITLLGGWSPSSGYRHFPRAVVCPFTGADDVEAVDLPGEGTVLLHTEVLLAPPGYFGPVPYGLGVVELEGAPPLRIVTRLQGDDIRPGARVALALEEVPDADGNPLATWTFRS
jgi:uncharacterized OB-fold protein